MYLSLKYSHEESLQHVAQHGHKHARSPSLSSVSSRTCGPVNDIGCIDDTVAHKCKANKSDYILSTHKLMNAACDQYNVRLLTIDPFPIVDDAAEDARTVWADACNDAEKIFAENDSSRVHGLVSSDSLPPCLLNYRSKLILCRPLRTGQRFAATSATKSGLTS